MQATIFLCKKQIIKYFAGFHNVSFKKSKTLIVSAVLTFIGYQQTKQTHNIIVSYTLLI